MIHHDTPPRASAAKPAPDCTLVIFGVTGDLTHRLLMPALYNLARWNLLPERFAIVGVGRSEMGADDLRDDLTRTMEGFVTDKGGEFSADSLDREAWARVVGRLDYLAGDVEDPATYQELSRRIGASREAQAAGGNVLFYLAVAARFFGPVVKWLGEAGLTREGEGAWRRVIIEKPFGHDLPSARALNRDVLAVLREDQVFRIDHFLGKETVQNIMAFRFGNGLFEPLWNRDRIDHVQITVAETVGVEKRGSFYDATGAMRDMVPNHLFQLFTMTAMEPPISFEADAVRDKKEEVLMAVHQLSEDAAAHQAVRAQYAAGTVRGQPVRSYRDEPDVDPGSQTETYVALRLTIDNWRWAGVPFYLRTGKAMTRRDTEIAIQFKQAPLALFRGTAVEACIPNWLVLQIQPDEGISLQFGAKVPGTEVRLGAVNMDFLYKDYFQIQPSTGYETLIYDAMIGDATLFQRADNIEAGWRAVQPVLDAWSDGRAPMAAYPAGSAGPKEADDLLARDGRAWRPL
ncbi:MAG: glucose-6-phosphate dehydrogenase [Methylobacterium sp.]|uniref:glucose-6-phosphate dehydrogenase n=1 Tax=Methylobacterium sp. TaxID=409 RepID=UPI0025E34AD9|nr:glucose-6-phosphate dehydrogenase [Methylobacterium sp.]MBX9933556.1 glucose-6-phosphate dehydrogenase [Methylobacterium sp.]